MLRCLVLHCNKGFPDRAKLDPSIHHQTSEKAVEIVIWAPNPNSSIFPNRNRNPRVFRLKQRGGLRLRLRLRLALQRHFWKLSRVGEADGLRGTGQ